MTTANKQSIFISYSRSDLKFSLVLFEKLRELGFDCHLDNEDIVPGESWRERVGQLIASSDSVVFLISRKSLDSDICRWELTRAEELGKRIVPVLLEPVSTEVIPPRILEINFVRADHLDTSVPDWGQLEHNFWRDLLLAVRVSNVLWRREQARWLQRAQLWEHAPLDDRSTFLPRGSDALSLKNLFSSKPNDEVHLPPILLNYLHAVERQEQLELLEEREQAFRQSVEAQDKIAKRLRDLIERHEYDQAIRLGLAAIPTTGEMRAGMRASAQLLAMLSVACQCSPILQNRLTTANPLTLQFHDARSALHSVIHLTSTKRRENCQAAVEILSNGDVSARGSFGGEEYEFLLEGANAQVALLDPTGSTLVVQECSKGALNVWNLRDGAMLPTPKFSTSGLQIQAGSIGVTYCSLALENHAEFGPPGVMTFSGGAEPKVVIWRVNDPGSFHTLRGQRQVSELLEFAPNGTKLLSVANGKLAVWNLDTSPATFNPIALGGAYALTARFNATGTRLAVAGDIGVTLLQVFNPTAVELIHIAGGAQDAIFSTSGSCILITIDSQKRLLASSNSSSHYFRSERLESELLEPVFDDFGRVYRLISNSEFGCQVTRDSRESVFSIRSPLLKPCYFWVNSNGTAYLMVGHLESSQYQNSTTPLVGRLQSAESGIARDFSISPQKYASLVSVSRDGRRFAFRPDRLHCCIMEVNSIEPAFSVELPLDDELVCLEFGTPSDILAMGFKSGLTKLLDLSEGGNIIGTMSDQAPAFNLRIGRSLAVSWRNSEFQDIEIIDFRLAKRRSIVRGHKERADPVARHGHGTRMDLNALKLVELTADEEYLLTVGSDQTAKLWRTSDGLLVASVEETKGELTGACLSPSRKNMFTWTSSGIGRLWCLDSAMSLLEVTAGGDEIVHAKWLATHEIVALTAGGTVVKWDTTWITGVQREDLYRNALQWKVVGDDELSSEEMEFIGAAFGSTRPRTLRRHANGKDGPAVRDAISRWQSRFIH